MKNVGEQKKKLERKKSRLAAEEIRLKQAERKMRTRHLIEIGGLIVKAELDHLPKETLYGAFLSLKEQLNDSALFLSWTDKGKEAFDKEQESKTPIILRLEKEPDAEMRKNIRSHNLSWNSFRQEWYGSVADLSSLKNILKDYKYDIEYINND